MTVERKLASEYRQDLENEIISRDDSIETQFGPVRDVFIRPAAEIFEDQNSDIINVENLQTLAVPSTINTTDLDELAFNNWQIKRSEGTKATGSVVFRTVPKPTVDLTVESGFPVATVQDDETGDQVQFITSTSATLPAATAELFFNSSTGFYELEVSIIAVLTGVSGNVAANRIIVAQRPLSGFTSITNLSGTAGGSDQESNEDVVERIQISRLGIDISTPVGIETFVRRGFSEVDDVIVVFGDDPLLTRASTDSGAVDSYIKGVVVGQRTDIYEFSGADHVFSNQPVDSIVSVTDGFTTFIQDTDYQLVKDTGDNAGSVRAVDALNFIATGANPSIGATVTVIYDTNQLIIDLQSTFDLPINLVLGRDLLFKEALQIEIVITADLTVLSGFSPSAVQGNVRTAIKNFVNALKLGEDVQQFDVSSAVVTLVQGVDNLTYTLFDIFGGSAIQDVTIEKNEFANIIDANLIVNLV